MYLKQNGISIVGLGQFVLFSLLWLCSNSFYLLLVFIYKETYIIIFNATSLECSSA